MNQTGTDPYMTEINLIEALKCALVHWRKALIFGLIFAIALAGYSFRGQLKARASAREEYDELIETYNGEMEEYESKIEQFNTDIETAQTKIDELTEYGEKSILLKIAPKKKATASADILVTMKDLEMIVSENGLIYDPTDTLLLLYANGVISRTDWSKVAEVSDEDSEYAYEIVGVSRNEAANLVTISVDHYDVETAKIILHELIRQLEERQSEMANAVGVHTLMVLNERSRLSIDDNLETKQNNYTSSIDSYMKTIEDKNTQLEELEEPVKPVYEYSRSKIMKKVIIYGIVGLILGVGIILAWYVFRFATDGKIHSEQELKEYGIVRILGSLVAAKAAKNLKGVDRKLAKWSGLDLVATEEQLKDLAEAKTRSYAGDVRSVALVGSLNPEDTTKLTDVVKRALMETEVRVGADPQNDTADYQTVLDSEAVILVEEVGASKYAQLLENKSLAESLGKTVIGCILV